ncbi:MAG: hypothetical protein ABI690_13605 [Chloroflexota bacterium]
MQDVQQKLDAVQRDLDEMQRHLDTLTGLIHSIRGQNLAVTRLGYQILLEERREMNTKAAEVNRKLEDLLEGKQVKNVKRIERLVVMLVIVLLLAGLAVVVSAQDAPLATNTAQIVDGTATLVSSEPIATAVPAPAATEQSPVIVVNPAPTSDPSDRTIYVIGFLAFLLVTLGSQLVNRKQVGDLVATINKAFDNKQVLDEARQRYAESSLSVQEFVKLARSLAGFAGSMNIPGIDPVLDKASDFLGSVTRPDAPAAQSLYPDDPQIGTVTEPDPAMRGAWKEQYPVDDEPQT